MTLSCAPTMLPWPLSRRGQELISWDVAGLPAGATVDIQLEGTGNWHPMLISTELDMISIWVAGAEFPSPAAESVVVPVTSHGEIRVVVGRTTVFLDGGYIELLP